MSGDARGRADYLAVLREIARLAHAKHVTFLAASVAYYAIFSALSGLLLAVVVITAGGSGATTFLVDAIGVYLPPAEESAVRWAFDAASGGVQVPVVSVIVLLWGSLHVFRGLDAAFSRIYGLSERAPLRHQLRDAVLVGVAVGAGSLAMLIVGGLLVTDASLATRVAGYTVLFAGLAAVFFPMYVLFPDTGIDAREAIPGTLFTSLGWVAFQGIFQAYVGVAPAYRVTGLIGGGLLLLTWFYAGSTLLLLGAVVNVVLAGRTGATRSDAVDEGATDGEP